MLLEVQATRGRRVPMGHLLSRTPATVVGAEKAARHTLVQGGRARRVPTVVIPLCWVERAELEVQGERLLLDQEEPEETAASGTRPPARVAMAAMAGRGVMLTPVMAETVVRVENPVGREAQAVKSNRQSKGRGVAPAKEAMETRRATEETVEMRAVKRKVSPDTRVRRAGTVDDAPLRRKRANGVFRLRLSIDLEALTLPIRQIHEHQSLAESEASS